MSRSLHICCYYEHTYKVIYLRLSGISFTYFQLELRKIATFLLQLLIILDFCSVYCRISVFFCDNWWLSRLLSTVTAKTHLSLFVYYANATYKHLFDGKSQLSKIQENVHEKSTLLHFVCVSELTDWDWSYFSGGI